MRDQQQRGTVESLAYAIMPDHLHWLFALVPYLQSFRQNDKKFIAHF
jgi:REP element-mobilizing transposase RayT